MFANLEKKYKKILMLEDLTEKDIIYFCRDALSRFTKKEDKTLYEKEILNLIKIKEWDWTVKDIDDNNILLYPIHNNSFEIVKYLIENKKYNLQIYTKDISKALCSCIMPIGEEMQQYLLNQNLDNQYIGDMIFHSYSMSVIDKMKEDFKTYYFQKAQSLLKQDNNFEKILTSFLENHEFNKYKIVFVNFLEQHTLSMKEKLNIIKPILELEKQNNSAFMNIEKYKILDNWVRYVELDMQLKPKNILHKKSKI